MAGPTFKDQIWVHFVPLGYLKPVEDPKFTLFRRVQTHLCILTVMISQDFSGSWLSIILNLSVALKVRLTF